MEPHTRLRGHPFAYEVLVGVLARLCNHLQRDGRSNDPSHGLTIGLRDSFHILPHVSRAVYILPGSRRPIPLGFCIVRDPQYCSRYPLPSSQRLATTTAPQPPTVANGVRVNLSPSLGDCGDFCGEYLHGGACSPLDANLLNP